MLLFFACTADDSAGDSAPDGSKTAGGESDLTDPDVALFFAEYGSAPQVLLVAVAPLVTVSEDCPSTSVAGQVTTYSGGCTDAGGTTWTGSAVVTQTGETTGEVAYDGFGFSSPDESCGGESSGRWDGSLSLGERDFGTVLHVRSSGADDDCLPISYVLEYDYAGAGDIGEDVGTYEGSGTMAEEHKGSVSLRTEAEAIDSSRCETEALSGSTTVQAGGHEVVVHYDGATTCTDPGRAHWSLDGVDQGEAEVACATARPGLLGAFTGLALLLRRRRGSRRPDGR